MKESITTLCYFVDDFCKIFNSWEKTNLEPILKINLSSNFVVKTCFCSSRIKEYAGLLVFVFFKTSLLYLLSRQALGWGITKLENIVQEAAKNSSKFYVSDIGSKFKYKNKLVSGVCCCKFKMSYNESWNQYKQNRLHWF